MEIITYQAVFLDETSIKKLIEMQKEKLPKMPKDMHCTFKFMPSNKEIEEFSKVLLGKKVSLKVVGYSSNGKNSGFEIELEPEQELVYTNSHIVKKDETSKVERTTPHITVSMSKDAKAVDTGFLNFEPLQEPFEITGTGGFFVTDREKNTKGVIYEPISKQTHNQSETELEK